MRISSTQKSLAKAGLLLYNGRINEREAGL